MDGEYKQLKDIKLHDILDLADGPFKLECLSRLIDCNFIEREEPEWKEITMRDLNKIRPGTVLKRDEEIIHISSDPYWSEAWSSFPHILVCRTAENRGYKNEYSINDLFDGLVHIRDD